MLKTILRLSLCQFILVLISIVTNVQAGEGGMVVKVHYEMYDGLPLTSKWIEANLL